MFHLFKAKSPPGIKTLNSFKTWISSSLLLKCRAALTQINRSNNSPLFKIYKRIPSVGLKNIILLILEAQFLVLEVKKW